MKKKIISMLLCASMMLSVVACSDATDSSNAVKGITIPDYKNMEVEEVALIEVSEDDVQGYIDYILSANAQSAEITDRPVQEGDIVNIDYKGLLDGVAFEGGTAEAQDLTIGSGLFIDGFEEGLIGANVGDELELELSFPDDYKSEELMGQDVIFEVKVNSISEQKIPELTDEFVMENSATSTTVDEYREEITAMFETENLNTQAESIEQQVWSTLIDATVVDEYPEEELTALQDEVHAYYEQYASYYGLEIDAFVEQSGMTMEEYEAVVLQTAQEIYVSEVVVTEIANNEGLALTEEEYQAEIDNIVETYGYESEDALYEEAPRESVEIDILTDIVMDWLVENVTFVESSADAETEETAE